MNPAISGRLEKFFSKFPFLHFDRKNILLTSSEDPKGIYFLKSGFVRQFSTSDRGQELTIHIFEAGSFFPVGWAVNDFNGQFFYESLTDCDLYLAPKTEVLEFLKKDPEILFDLTSRLVWGIQNLSKRIESLSFDSAYKRVISILIYLTKHFGQKSKNKTTIPHFTHDDIAHLAALTRERTSLQMEKLQKKELIAYEPNRSIIIINLKLLKEELEISK